MRLLFIRHAVAEDREIHDGNDLLRELSEKGRERAHIVCKMLASYYGTPTYIFTSTALRAVQTAEIVSKHFGVNVNESEALLPGANIESFKQLLAPYYKKDSTVIIVGHEPDFSFIISALISSEDVAISVKKASCIEIEIDEKFYGELKASIPPKFLMHFTTKEIDDTV